MSTPLYQVDAFTDRPFAGNPAAVCLLPEPRDEAWMQQVAAEMNLSETAFLVARDDGWSLRWFTPTVEVDLCGHATLASAHVLWEAGRLGPDEAACFHTKSGELFARRDGDWIELDFPAYRMHPCVAPPSLDEGLGVRLVHTVESRHNYLVELASESAVRGLEPDFRAIGELGRGVIATARSDLTDFDFVSRYFATAFGINEDPVTGSAHCYLGPFWQEKLGKNEFMARQISARGGVLRVRVDRNRTHIAGQAVTVFQGELTEQVPVAGR
jgi:PhzF family phenazine biosynthesis protein